MSNQPLINIQYDNDFRNSINSLLDEFLKITNDNIESQLMLVDYHVMKMKERAKWTLKDYNQRMALMTKTQESQS